MLTWVQPCACSFLRAGRPDAVTIAATVGADPDIRCSPWPLWRKGPWGGAVGARRVPEGPSGTTIPNRRSNMRQIPACRGRSEEHTSELQSRFDIVCRLLLEKKKKRIKNRVINNRHMLY